MSIETKMYFDREIYNIILIHTARCWERISLKTRYEEMPLDNIASIEAIEEIASEIIDNAIIQRFLIERNGDIWLETNQGMSDTYIDYLASNLIYKDYNIMSTETPNNQIKTIKEAQK